MARHATPYAETELLLAVMEDRSEDAQEIAAELLPRERVTLMDQLHRTMSVLMRTSQ